SRSGSRARLRPSRGTSPPFASTRRNKGRSSSGLLRSTRRLARWIWWRRAAPVGVERHRHLAVRLDPCVRERVVGDEPLGRRRYLSSGGEQQAEDSLVVRWLRHGLGDLSRQGESTVV